MRYPRNVLALIAMATVVGLIPTAAPAQEETATYIATPGLRPGQVEEAALGIGGYQFMPESDPKKIKIEDLNGAGIVWIACQENPSQEGEAPSTCGDGDDASAGGCSTGDFQPLDDRFQPGTPLTVFIVTTNPGIFVGPDCEQIATAGTITLKF